MNRFLNLTGLVALFVLFAVGVSANWVDVRAGWQTTAGALNLSNNIRGVALNPATGNLVVTSTDNNIAIVNKSNGSLIKNIPNAGTGDATISLYRVGVSDDGYIYTQGFGGTVKLIGTEAVTDATTPILTFNVGGAGSTRTMVVKGSHTAGTAKVYVLRRTNIYVWGNTPGDVNTYAQLTAIAHGYTDAQADGAGGLAVSDDLSMVVAHSPSGGIGSRKFDINVPGDVTGGYTADASFITPSGCAYRNDVAFDEHHRVWGYSSAHNLSGIHYMVTRFNNMDTDQPIGAGIPLPGGAVNGAGFYNVSGAVGSNLVGTTAFDKQNNVVYAGSTDTLVQWNGVVPRDYAGPYAGLIRVSGTSLGEGIGGTISYVLPFEADSATIEILNATNAVVATFAGTSDSGMNIVAWDGTANNAGGAVVPADSGYQIRITVDNDIAEGWFVAAFNSSTWSATTYGWPGNIFPGYSPNIPVAQKKMDSDLFGLIHMSSSYNDPTYPSAAMILLRGDLQPLEGNGYDNRVLRHPTSPITNGSIWGSDFIPDSDRLVLTGQNVIFYTTGNGLDTNAVDARGGYTLLGNPRSNRVVEENGQLWNYMVAGNSVIDKARIGSDGIAQATSINVLSPTSLGLTLYGKDLAFDEEGNIYWLSRDARLFRWSAADVQAVTDASSQILDATGIQWDITWDAGLANRRTMGVEVVAGKVYVGAANAATPTDFAIYEIGDVATASLVKSVTTSDIVFQAGARFTDGTYAAIRSDAVGNLITNNRGWETTHLLSPGGLTKITTNAPSSQTFNIVAAYAEGPDFKIFAGPTADVYDQANEILGTKAVSDSDILNGLVGTIVSGGLHPATVGTVANLTNGQYDANGLTIIAQDNQAPNPSLVLEYDFIDGGETADITGIRIFSGHDGDGSRVFINAKVEVDTGFGYSELGNLRTGSFGLAAPGNSSVAYVEWIGSATEVEKIRFTFENVSHNSTHFFQAPDDNTTNPPQNYPNQGTIIKEIDLFGTLNTTSVKEWDLY